MKDTSTSESESPPNSDHTAPDVDATERSNILTLVAHQTLFRTAWIFKTESIIMPAFLDSISGTGWIRGMLPLLNRFSQSIVPLLLSDRLSRSSEKSRWLSRSTLLMSVPFLAIGGMLIWLGSTSSGWFVAFFLIAYTVFFSVNGVTQATLNTLQGKLIRPQHRGRLMAISGYIGAPVAILMAWLLLRPWTQASPPKFAAIFLFTGGTFLLASFTVGRLRELPDPVRTRTDLDVRRRFREAWQSLQQDPHLRRLCIVAALFVSAQLLFPHYQRLGRHQSGFEGQMLMIWVIAQHLSAAIFSWASGRIADQRGTRAAIRWLTFLTVLAPLVPLILTKYISVKWYWLTFAWLGLVPVTFRMFLNYSLELTHRIRHPIYVSTVVLCMAPPILLSPLVGEFVERVGYVIPFSLISGALIGAWLLTLSMVEPRSDDFTAAYADDDASQAL